jgi:integrase/recombinase XerD
MSRDRTSADYLFRVYLNNCRVEGHTAKTPTWHTTALSKLAAYLESIGSTDIREVTRDELRDYVAHLQQLPGRNGAVSPHSVATYVRSMRAFFAWLAEEGYLDENPAKRVREPKAGERDVTVLSLSDVRVCWTRARASTQPETGPLF